MWPSFGAKQYHMVGNYTSCAIISLILTSFPISILWIFMDKLLILLGQDQSISLVAGKYCIYLIPSLFGNAILQALVRYFQTQSLIFPMLLISVIGLVLHIPICWLLVFALGLGRNGAALSIGISFWLIVISLGFYVKYSQACKKTKIVFGMISLENFKEFFFLAIPSAFMLCLEAWSYELIVIFAGLLPNPQLQTSVLSICLGISALHFFIPYGIGAAVSTRVSNELGAGKPQAARDVVSSVIVLTLIEAIIVSSTLFCFGQVLGFAFSNEMEVAQSVAKIVPLLCISIFLDSLLGVLYGVVTGIGWQKIGAITNLGVYYIVAIPMALLLGFGLGLQAKGLWIGILTGSTLQIIVFPLITTFTNWEKQVHTSFASTS